MGNEKDFNIIASLNIPKSTSQIESDLKTIEKNLQDKQIKINISANTEKIKKQTTDIGTQIDNLNKNVKPIDIFNAKTLDNEGRKFFT